MCTMGVSQRPMQTKEEKFWEDLFDGKLPEFRQLIQEQQEEGVEQYVG